MNIATARNVIAANIWRRRKTLSQCSIFRPSGTSWTFAWGDKEYLAGLITGITYGLSDDIAAIAKIRTQAFRIIDRRINHGAQ